MEDKESQLLLKLIIQSLEKLDDQLAVAGEKNYKAIGDLDDKITTIGNSVSTNTNSLIKNTVSLEEHIRRTEANEAMIEIIRTSLEPVRSIYDWAIISGKVIAILALLVTIIGGLFKTAIFLLGVK